MASTLIKNLVMHVSKPGYFQLTCARTRELRHVWQLLGAKCALARCYLLISILHSDNYVYMYIVEKISMKNLMEEK